MTETAENVVNEETKKETEQEVETEKVEAAAEESTEQESVEPEVVGEEQPAEAKSEEEDFKAKFYYLAAEMENARKRFDREKQQLIKYGNEKVLSGLLDVMDNFERTLQAIENDTEEKVKNIFTGISMVSGQMIEVLKGHGLEEVDALGKQFDPNVHEAMAQQPSEEEEGTVINVFQKGYTLNGRLLRPAKVIVAKKS